MSNKYKRLLFILVFAALPLLIIGGCDDENGGGGGGACPETNIGIEVCDPEAGPFSLIIDNGFFPVVVGSESVLEDEEGDARLEITVPGDMEEVAGVNTRVLVETEFEGDLLIEVSRNFFTQVQDGAPGAGTVCYFGEDVDICDTGLQPDGNGGYLCDGEEPDHSGEWRAGVNGAIPGIFMLADPEVDNVYNEEIAPDVAEDIAEVTALGDPIEVLDEIFFDTLTTRDCNPLDPGPRDTKIYIRDIGIAQDGDLFLVEFNP
ncbi:MAG: hypothetical protein WBD99_15440 [Thermodesulfobacteriota bacterium]